MSSSSTTNGPAGYRQKFSGFVAMCRQAKPGDVVTVATPHALGDNYSEIIESLNLLADTEATLLIVLRGRRGSSKPRASVPGH